MKFVYSAEGEGFEPPSPCGLPVFLTTLALIQANLNCTVHLGGALYCYLSCCSLDYFLTMLFSLGFICIVSTPFTHFCDLVSHHQLWCHHQIGFCLLGWFYFWSFPQSTRINKTAGINHSPTPPIVWSYFQRTFGGQGGIRTHDPRIRSGRWNRTTIIYNLRHFVIKLYQIGLFR